MCFLRCVRAGQSFIHLMTSAKAELVICGRDRLAALIASSLSVRLDRLGGRSVIAASSLNITCTTHGTHSTHGAKKLNTKCLHKACSALIVEKNPHKLDMAKLIWFQPRAGYTGQRFCVAVRRRQCGWEVGVERKACPSAAVGSSDTGLQAPVEGSMNGCSM